MIIDKVFGALSAASTILQMVCVKCLIHLKELPVPIMFALVVSAPSQQKKKMNLLKRLKCCHSTLNSFFPPDVVMAFFSCTFYDSFCYIFLKCELYLVEESSSFGCCFNSASLSMEI